MAVIVDQQVKKVMDVGRLFSPALLTQLVITDHAAP